MVESSNKIARINPYLIVCDADPFLQVVEEVVHFDLIVPPLAARKSTVTALVS